MRNVVIAVFLIFTLSNCNKDKIDEKKFLGSWKRETWDISGGSVQILTGVDTVVFSEDNYIQLGVTYKYFVKDGKLVIYLDDNSGAFFINSYEFKNESHIRVRTYGFGGDRYYYDFFKL